MNKPANNRYLSINFITGFMLLKRRPSSPVIFLLFVVSTLLFGCTSMKETEILHQNNILQEKNSKLEAELAEENAVSAGLAMKLVDKQKEIDRIKFAQEHLSEEIAHTKARRPAPTTKVEIVTYLAEVETDINAAKELASDSEQPIFDQAERFVSKSKVELERGNYDTARSLASQAMELVQAIRTKTAIIVGKAESTYTEFIPPVHLRLAKRCNIRNKPTIQGKILTTLAPKTPVTASGYQGDWIKITSNIGQKGWIHYSLLSVSEKTLPIRKPVKEPGLLRDHPD